MTGSVTSSGPRNQIDPVTVEVIGSAMSSIVEEMGEALVLASYSTNIKERRDCSTALFDTRGTIPSWSMKSSFSYVPSGSARMPARARASP